MGAEQEREARAARRAFIRDHHPDRGGDPALFRSGLERFRPVDVIGTRDHESATIVVVRRPRLFTRMAARVNRRIHPPPPRVR